MTEAAPSDASRTGGIGSWWSGGGFGGLNAVRALAHADVDVTVIDRTNHHLFQPLLYQVAAGILPPGLIAPALRGVIKKQRNARALLGEVTRPRPGRAGGARHRAGRAARSSCPTTRWSWPAARPTPTSAATTSPSSRPGMKTVRGRPPPARPDPAGVRDGRAGHRSGGAGRVADVRGDRRRPDRGGAGRAGRRAGAQGAAAGLPRRRTPARPGSCCWRAPARCCRPFAEKLQRYTQRRLEEMGVEVRLNTLAVGMDERSVTVKGPDGEEVIRDPDPDLGRRGAGLRRWPRSSPRRPARRPTGPAASRSTRTARCPGTPRCSRSATWCR